MLRAAKVKTHKRRYFTYVVSGFSYCQAVFLCVHHQFPFTFPSKARLQNVSSPQIPGVMSRPSPCEHCILFGQEGKTTKQQFLPHLSPSV